MPGRLGGRFTSISGSRPTISVSVWWRAWPQRWIRACRSIMKEAIWWMTVFSHWVRKAVPWKHSCWRESPQDANRMP